MKVPLHQKERTKLKILVTEELMRELAMEGQKRQRMMRGLGEMAEQMAAQQNLMMENRREMILP